MPKYYSSERSVRILVSLMKQHGIRKIIVSPGMKNIPFVASVQFDPYFTLYSCVDERSAAYMACGMAIESGEPVALSCTGATASRNYISALTEAYYSNIPILAITSISHTSEVGHLIPQMIDRSVQQKDIVRKSVQINPIHSEKDAWEANILINDALLELRHNNCGPVHINLVSNNYRSFQSELEPARKVNRYSLGEKCPEIKNKRVAIFVGTHKYMDDDLTIAIDKFCKKYNGVVICDNTSNYFGKYRVNPSRLSHQVQKKSELLEIDLMIHIGDVSGAYFGLKPKKVWRINADGRIQDTFKTLECLFEMKELHFFEMYCETNYKTKYNNKVDSDYLAEWKKECDVVDSAEVDLPFSNAWIASRIEPNIPSNSVLELGILNSLRNWNMFNIPSGIRCHSNTGGFGIDGMLSTTIGSAIVSPQKLFYLVLGDLSFFYDINSLGNRHIPKNLRIILINNGRGVEFRNYRHPSEEFGEDADYFMAAGGHFGNKSKELVRHFATDLGIKYYSAHDKDSFEQIEKYILDTDINGSCIFECFTDPKDEKKALELLYNIIQVRSAKETAKNILGEERIKKIQKLLSK